MMRPVAAILALLLTCTTCPAQVQRRSDRNDASEQKLAVYESRYYIMHTDLPLDQAREADIRMTRMAEEYHARTRDFSGAIRRKFPFYLFRHEADYVAAGGKPGTAGVFMHNTGTLMAIAGEELTADTWHTVQHEGFHQFALAVIGGELPIWVNEGLAEYFGEGLFTGDGFVMGVVPEWRRERIAEAMRGKALLPIRQMMMLSHERWNEDMKLEHYDQAWSMVHFLVHAENGKFRDGFAGFIRAIGNNQPWEKAWLAHLGTADGFEQRWRAYWLKMPKQPTDDLYAEAAVQTLTSFIARAAAEGQRITSMKQLVAAAQAEELKIDEKDWLPPALLEGALRDVSRMIKENGDKFVIEMPPGKLPQVRHTARDGSQRIGRFTLRGGRVNQILVDSGQQEDRKTR
jgi:hypothetical protein